MNKRGMHAPTRSVVITLVISLGIAIGMLVPLPLVRLDFRWVVIDEGILATIGVLLVCLVLITLYTPLRMNRSMATVLSLAFAVRTATMIPVRPQLTPITSRLAAEYSFATIVGAFSLGIFLIFFRKPVWTLVAVALVDLGYTAWFYAMEMKLLLWDVREHLAKPMELLRYIMLGIGLEILPLGVCWASVVWTYSRMKRRSEFQRREVPGETTT